MHKVHNRLLAELCLAQESLWAKRGRELRLMIRKAGTGGYWPRLTATKSKLSFIKADWDRWADSDEEDEDGADPGGFGTTAN